MSGGSNASGNGDGREDGQGRGQMTSVADRRAAASADRPASSGSRGAASWKPTPLQNVLVVLMSVAIAILVVTGTFCILLTPYPTHAFASLFVADDVSSVSHDELVETAEQTLAYCNADPDAELPLGDDEQTSYTEDVVGHLDDVTVFFSGMKMTAAVSAVAVVALLVLIFASARKGSADQPDAKPSSVAGMLASRAMLAGAIVVAVLLVAIAAAALIDFNSIFNFLHSFFFASGSWTFPSDSLLICALPEEFWMAMAVLWGAILVVVLAALVIASRSIRSHARGGLASR